MSSLKQKTISGLIWSFIDNFSKIGIEFIIGIILARILSPKEFGLIGMITVFIAISQAFIDSGFSNSLIRKKDCNQKDYSTVFYFNLVVGVVFYILLYFLAIPISNFFKEPKLIDIIRVLGVVLIISSLSLIQKAILTKRVDFKLQTKISIISSVISGIIAIYMAYSGYGVWSLVWKTIFAALLTTVLLWFWNSWYPLLIFNIKTFKVHFTYGYKLLLTSLINTLYINVYYVIIGKYYSPIDLGFYTRAQQFSNFPSSNITNVISRVSFPILSQLQNEPEKLKIGYQKLIKSTMFMSFVLMIGMAAVAKPLVLTLIGAKWAISISYLQILCFSAMLYPLHALNLNILYAKGRSDLALKIEIIKKLMIIPIVLVALSMGIKAMLFGLIVASVLAYLINGFYSGKLINYSIKEQILDIVPSFIYAIIMGAFIFCFDYYLPLKPIYMLIFQISIGCMVIIAISEFFKLEGYFEIKNMIYNLMHVDKKDRIIR